MRVLISIFALLAVTAAVSADFQHPTGRHVMYVRDGAPATGDQWTLAGSSHPKQVVEFHLPLPQRDVEGLKQRLYEVADPKSADYGQWLSREQVMEFVATEPSVAETVKDWLLENGNGLVEINSLGDNYKVFATVDYVERLFHTKMHAFRNMRTGAIVHKHLGSLSVPSDIASHLSLVTGITEFPPARLAPHATTLAPGDACNTPISMRELYNLTDADQSDPSMIQAPFADASGPDGFGKADIAIMQTACDLAPNPIQTNFGGGDYVPYYDDGEANLDMCMITTFGINATTDFFLIPTGWIYEYTQQFANITSPPIVNSISYAWNEDQECANNTLPFLGHCRTLDIPNSQVYVNRTNVEFMKLVAQGLTFLSSSGDGGTNGGHGGDSCVRTHPLFPACSPYVVSVGGTVTTEGGRALPGNWSQPICSGHGKASCECNVEGEQIAAMVGNYAGFDSGGGFSQFSETPSYQASFVSGYLESNATRPTAPDTFNGGGRGYPDVSAIAGNVAVIIDGSLSLQGGTSASTPQVAGMISILNSLRVKSNQPLLGFVHPLLYQAAQDCPECFYDVTTGYNGQDCRDMGFEATTGWDPVTGLGSISFANLLEYLKL